MSSFFHTLVVFGAGASLAGCGAKVTGDEGGGHSGPHGGREATEGGVSTGAAGGRPAGMGGAMGTGGVVGAGGAVSTGGSAGAAGATAIDPRTAAQWSCDGVWSDCTQVTTATGSRSAFVLNDPCPVDPARPRSAADCSAGEQLECARALFGEAVLAVDCLCVPLPMPPDACVGCTPRYSGDLHTDDAVCNGRTKLCGCMTGILR